MTAIGLGLAGGTIVPASGAPVADPPPPDAVTAAATASSVVGWGTASATVRRGGQLAVDVRVLPAGVRRVAVQYRLRGATRWVALPAVTSNALGRATVRFAPPKAGVWQVRLAAAATRTARAAITPARTVTCSGIAGPSRVLGWTPAAASMASGGTLARTITVSPGTGRRVALQAKAPGARAFATVQAGRTSSKGAFTTRFTTTRAGTWSLRVMVEPSATSRAVVTAARGVTVALPDHTAPGAPTGLHRTARTRTTIALAWTNPIAGDLAAIIVRRAAGDTAPATATAGSPVALPAAKAAAATDAGLAGGSTYSYAVFARDTAGNTSTAAVLTTSTTGAISLVSASATGEASDSAARYPSFSPDGTKVAYYTWASNLVPGGDTNGTVEPYIKDLTTGAVIRVATTAAGAGGDGEASTVSWAPDSNRVVFHSSSSDLVPGTVARYNVYLKDLTTGALTLLSKAQDGTPSNAGSEAPVFSPDGTKVAFGSWGSNLVAGDTNGTDDIFVKDLATGAVTLASSTPDGTQPNSWTGEPLYSPDGTKIAFRSSATNLVPGGTTGWFELFVKDLVTGGISLVAAAADGTESNGMTRDPAWSPDSTSIAFDSEATNLVPGDTNGKTDVFVKVLATGAITRLSTGTNGVQGDGNSLQPAWSPDGASIAFSTGATNFVPGDTNATGDIVVRALATGAMVNVSTAVDGTQGNDWAEDPVWSADGTRVAFATEASNLVPGDTNGQEDVFVVTVG